MNPDDTVRLVNAIHMAKNSYAPASFKRAGVITFTVITRNNESFSSQNGIHEFPYRAGSGILDRYRKALNNLG